MRDTGRKTCRNENFSEGGSAKALWLTGVVLEVRQVPLERAGDRTLPLWTEMMSGQYVMHGHALLVEILVVK